MKFSGNNSVHISPCVVPLAGTWIEINQVSEVVQDFFVVPLAGTWIEIGIPDAHKPPLCVVPLAGTWIEMA